MKMLPISLLLILLACLLIACDGTAEPEELPPLEPGDALGEMSIVAFNYPSPHITNYCEKEALSSGTCQVPADLGQLNIMNGWEEETAEALEAVWADSSWNLIVDGNRVNLDAFGAPFWDEEAPAMRYWSVALQHPTAGEHIVEWTYDIAGEHIEESWTFTVTDELSINE